MNRFERKFEEIIPTRQSNKRSNGAKTLLDRDKRDVLSLESLEKRLKALEFRWDFYLYEPLIRPVID